MAKRPRVAGPSPTASMRRATRANDPRRGRSPRNMPVFSKGEPRESVSILRGDARASRTGPERVRKSFRTSGKTTVEDLAHGTRGPIGQERDVARQIGRARGRDYTKRIKQREEGQRRLSRAGAPWPQDPGWDERPPVGTRASVESGNARSRSRSRGGAQPPVRLYGRGPHRRGGR